MKKITLLVYIIFALTFAISSCQTVAYAQQIDKITRKCPSPNSSLFGNLLVTLTGDVTYTPCPTRTSIFTGNVDFSGATVTGLPSGSGNVSATGAVTTNFFPIWNTGAAKNLVDSPYSWNGTLYQWRNTAASNTFLMKFTPTLGSEQFQLGNGTTESFIAQATGNDLWTAASTLSISSPSATFGSLNALVSTVPNVVTVGSTLGNATMFTVNNTTGDFILDGHNGSSVNNKWNTGDGTITLGDTGGIANAVKIIICDACKSIDLNTNALGRVQINDGTTAAAEFNRGAGQVVIGDLNAGTPALELDSGATPFAQLTASDLRLGNTANSLRILAAGDKLASTLSVWDLSTAGGAGFGVTSILLDRTITAAGTTGNQTINLPNGSVNIAAGNSSIVITNSTVTTSSTIIAVANTADATCSVKNAVPTANTITIAMTAACTAETRVAFWVWN
jgi:hypothetical protein